MSFAVRGAAVHGTLTRAATEQLSLHGALTLSAAHDELSMRPVVTPESVGEKNGPLYDALFALIGAFPAALARLPRQSAPTRLMWLCTLAADRDGNGSIDFNEYVQACATFCMYTKQDIMACTSPCPVATSWSL